MKRLSFVFGSALVILPWLSGTRAQADAIHWTASENLVGAASNGVAQLYPQNGVDAAINLSPGNATSGTNFGNMVAAQISYSINPDAMQAATFGGPAADYSLRLSLHDASSGVSGSLTFRGNVSGNTDGFGDFTNTFLGSTSQTLTLGRDLYTVKIGFVPTIPPDNNGLTGGDIGSISASIAVQPSVNSNSTPEPSSLLLACLGLPTLGLGRCLRRRKSVARDA